MNNFQIFFRTRVKGESSIGNNCLAPVRYFFNGKTVRIFKDRDAEWVNHVSSFHRKGHNHKSRFDESMSSSWKGWEKKLFCIIFLLPGLFVGTLFKGISYLTSKSVRDHHHLVKLHLNVPRNITIGSKEDPLLTEEELKQELEKNYRAPLYQKIHALIIYGNNIDWSKDIPEIRKLNPKKMILVGARIIHDFDSSYHAEYNCLDLKLYKTKKWEHRYVEKNVVKKVEETFVRQIPVKTIEEALADIPPLRHGKSKRFHTIYIVQSDKE